MSAQSEAMRLADLWEKHSHGYARTPEARTAAELRRLSAVEAQRDALLEALKEMLKVWEEDPAYGHASAEKARAAIKAVEESK